MLRHPTTVKIGWSKEREDGGEDCYDLHCLVTPPDDGRHGRPDQWTEPDPGGVEVLEVRDETGALRPDMLDEAQEGLDEAEAMEQARDADYNPRWDDHDD